ncbi:MAG: hypothetical protein AB4041_07375 [Microcystaceae cyanobacterium]
MTGKVLSDNPNGILILILPVAAAIILLYKAWPLLLLFLLLLIIWRVWDTYQWNQWNQELSPFFNQLIQENQGCLTPMDLSVKTNLSSKAAKRFLDRKAEEYGALRKDRGEQGIVYYFLTATALGSIFDESEPEALPESDRTSVAFESPTVTEASPSTEGVETKPEPQEAISVVSPQETVTVSETEALTTPDAEEVVEGTESEPETQEAVSVASPSEAVTEDKPTAPPTTSPDVPKTSGSSSFAQLAVLKEERQQASEGTKAETSIEERKPDTTVTETSSSSSHSQFSKGLIQADLAKRLDLNPSTVGRRKSDPDFAEWSQSKDPDGIAWKYVRKRKRFIPVEN